MHARLRGVAAVIVAAALVQNCATHDTEKTYPRLSKVQLSALAAQILENTPEKLHWAPGTKFDWVLLDSSIVAPESLQKEVVQMLKQRYEVYYREDEVPRELVKKESDGQIGSYRKGFLFGYTVEFTDRKNVTIKYFDWENMLAGSSHTTVYLWTGTAWQVEKDEPLMVS